MTHAKSECRKVGCLPVAAPIHTGSPNLRAKDTQLEGSAVFVVCPPRLARGRVFCPPFCLSSKLKTIAIKISFFPLRFQGKLRQPSERSRKRIRITSIEDKTRMSIDYNEEKEKDEFPRQCYGPGCTNAARSGSKYCSDECGIHLVVISIRSLRKHNIDMENVSPKYIFYTLRYFLLVNVVQHGQSILSRNSNELF